MSDRHLAYWPKNVPRHLVIPETNVFYNLQVSAHRHPKKPYLIYYDTSITFPELKDEAERMAGFLERECGVKKGDRVLLFMQNSPQFVIAYYAIMRANAVVVPINTMNLTNELREYVLDSDGDTALVAQELYPQVKPLIGRELKRVIVAAYSDYLKQSTDLRIPELIAAPRQRIADPGVTLWGDAMARNLRPGPITAGPDDLCVMPYTSGTTGRPRGCMHTHRTVMYTLVAGVHWFGPDPSQTTLAVLPFFHVTGMQGSMNGTIYSGNSIVLLPSWDREVAAQLIQRYRIDRKSTGLNSSHTVIYTLSLHDALPISSYRDVHAGCGSALVRPRPQPDDTRGAAVFPRDRHAGQHERDDLLGQQHRPAAALGSRSGGAANPALQDHRVAMHTDDGGGFSRQSESLRLRPQESRTLERRGRGHARGRRQAAARQGP